MLVNDVSVPDSWSRHEHKWGTSIAHDTLPIWCVFYGATNVRKEHWAAYIAIEPIIKGRHPCGGGVNNKRIGDENGFSTLSEACDAAERQAA